MGGQGCTIAFYDGEPRPERYYEQPEEVANYEDVLEGMDLEGADLTDADLHKANMDDVQLADSILAKALESEDSFDTARALARAASRLGPAAALAEDALWAAFYRDVQEDIANCHKHDPALHQQDVAL